MQQTLETTSNVDSGRFSWLEFQKLLETAQNSLYISFLLSNSQNQENYSVYFIIQFHPTFYFIEFPITSIFSSFIPNFLVSLCLWYHLISSIFSFSVHNLKSFIENYNIFLGFFLDFLINFPQFIPESSQISLVSQKFLKFSSNVHQPSAFSKSQNFTISSNIHHTFQRSSFQFYSRFGF